MFEYHEDMIEPVSQGAAGENADGDLAVRLGTLAQVPVEDDGSFATRLRGRSGLVDSMLGRSLLDPAGRARDAESLSAEVAGLVDVRGVVDLRDLDATLGALEAVRSRVNALEALEAVLLERVRRQAMRADGLLDGGEPMVRAASDARRRELARRTAVAEVALVLHQQEHVVAARMNRAQALVARAPRTVAGAVAGQVAWANASKVADAVAELDERTAGRLDAEVVHAARCQNVRRFSRTVSRVRERLCPAPAEVRHAEAATKRGVWVDPAADGMAWLTLFAPAVAIHAISDRLTTVSGGVRANGDGRTIAQVRADAACALLLDDGTLDLAAAADAAIVGTAETAETAETSGTAGADANATRRAGATAGAGAALGRTAFSLAAYARSVRPRVYVTVPVLTLLGRADAPALLDGRTPIDADMAREMAGLATSFTRLLTHPVTGRVLSVDAESYRPPADLRHYVKVRDNACRFPGCDRPVAVGDTDHTVAYAEGGPTAVGNLATLCRRHHVLKHQTRFTVRQIDDAGTLEWATPTGRTHRTRADLVPATIHRAPESPGDLGNREAGPPRGPDDGGGPPF
jgi:hypothetical protein